MAKEHNLELINGNFSAQDAKEILVTIFSNKIQFHQRKNFASKEKLGKEDKNALKRIVQLKKSLDKTYKLISEAELKNKRLDISAEVFIAFSNPK
jgi:hypothetical protein